MELIRRTQIFRSTARFRFTNFPIVLPDALFGCPPPMTTSLRHPYSALIEREE